MAVTIRFERFGAPAIRALRQEIDRLKGGDVLAPVTVVVPRAAVGLASRRQLAAEPASQASVGAGVANVRFVTLTRIAAELADAGLRASGSRSATAAAVHGAVRQALAGTEGVLGPVRSHPATVRALAGAYHELRPLPENVQRELARQSPRAAAVVALVTEVRSRLAGWHDDVDLAQAAAREVQTGGPTPPIGAVVLHLPLSLPPHHRKLVAVLAEASPTVAIIGLTGDPAADAPAMALATQLEEASDVRLDHRPAPVDPAAQPLAVHSVLSAPSADAEVLDVVRSLLARAEDGVPLEQMAIAHSGMHPYPRLVRQMLEEAGVPFHGGSDRPLSATLAGRCLLGAFAVAERGWRRDELLDWLAGAPLLFQGAPVPASAWDRVSCEAGVVEGLEEWRSRLAALAERYRRALEDPDRVEDDDGAGRHRASVAAQLELARSLGAFVAGLAARLESPPTRWDGWAAWCRSFLHEYLGGPHRRTGWPPEEEQALAAVEEALTRLGELDQVDPAPDPATFRSALASELDVPAPATARWGRGVLVGEVRQLLGTDLDVLFVVGMHDGAFPPPLADDPVLPDRERRAAGPLVPLRATRAAEARRDFLAALSAARHRSLSFARGDQRRGRVQRPSRWLLDGLQGVLGTERLYSRDLERLAGVSAYRVLPSYTAAMAADGAAASLADLDRRNLLRWRVAHSGIGNHPLARQDPVLRAGLAAGSARRRQAFTRYDGLVGKGAPSPADAEPRSPTGLETYAECPRRYLMKTVLRVGVLDRPETIVRLGPADRGQIMHEVLERFVRQELARSPGEWIAPARRWADEGGEARLSTIAEEVFADYEARGLTGRPLLWAFDRQVIWRDLLAFLAHDDARRARLGCTPVAVELPFGRHGEPPVVLDLGHGRSVAFRGVVDRVDVTTDGRAVVVDYKTGGTYGYEELANGDPVARGRRLQLPIYGLAAMRQTRTTRVEVGYWFVTQRQGFRSIGYELDHDRLAAFGHAVSVLVEGIEAGAFPARPGQGDGGELEHCRFCDYTAMCPGDRSAAWQRVRQAPVLSHYLELVEGGR
jgi:ATP-dependent helicase/nuclease subunit B